MTPEKNGRNDRCTKQGGVCPAARGDTRNKTDDHRRPFRRSSSRTEIATAVPANAMAMNSQRRVST